jgi:diguanylate cyclase (GGDEF)-like protein
VQENEMLDGVKVDSLAEGVWRVSCPTRGGILTINCYLIEDGTGFTAIEPGPASTADLMLAGVSTLVQPGKIDRLILLDSSPFGASGAAAWRSAGFKGEIYADWRTALGISEAGIPGPFRFIHKDQDEYRCEGPVILEFRTFDETPGSLFALHCQTGILFSGRLGSSMGLDLPSTVSAMDRPQQLYQKTFGLPGLELPALIQGFGSTVPTLICPRFGSALAFDDPARLQIDKLSKEKAEGAGEVLALLEEVEKLRADNLDLQSAMVFASDAALRDELSGLYDRAYANEFLRSLIIQGNSFCAAFIEIDRLKEYNRTAGVASGDQLLADIAGFLLENSSGGYLFRWAGPVFLLVLESDRESAYRRAEEIRAAVAAERRFSRPTTISVAIVGSDELETEGKDDILSDLQAYARARLKLLERRGGNEVLAESGSEIQEKSIALVLDGDSISADYLREFLNRQDFSAVGASRGGEALDLLAKYQPEVVIADAYLPQFDAFQIRARMLASADLRRIPFVLLVEAKTDEIVERAHTLQIFHIFEKPVPLRELLGVIRYLVRWVPDVR